MENQSSETKAQVVYFSHGGGPLPILGDASHKAMIKFMGELPRQLKRPEAIVVISAHWEESVPTIIGSDAPAMLYDYFGFPPKAYEISYPAPGDAGLAKKISDLLAAHKLTSTIDMKRGFDHGLFIPLKMMYPQADIPSIQLSLLKSLDPGEHINLGKALRGLMSENVLVIGSGFSFHNMRAFIWEGGKEADKKNDAFQDWLIETCTGQGKENEREKSLTEWEKAPNARYCHPREEHLLPLHVCAGMTNKPAKTVFDDYILGKRAVAFLWR